MISFACKHCGSPQTAENEDFAAITACYQCGRMALRDDAPPKAKPSLPPKPSPPTPLTPDLMTVKLGPYDPARRPLTFGLNFGFGFGIGFFLAGLFLAVVLVIATMLACGGLGTAVNRVVGTPKVAK